MGHPPSLSLRCDPAFAVIRLRVTADRLVCSNSLKGTLLAHLSADKANFSSRPLAVLACFVLLVYGLSWMIEVPAALTTLGLLHVHVSKGLQTMAQLTPAVAAVITAGFFYGRRAIVPTLLPLLKVRAPVRWYAVALLVAPATQAAALLLYRTMGHSLPAFGRWFELPMMVMVLALFSVGEELGWRGFFLPNLMKRSSLLAATAWMALFWGFWHLPFYFVANSEGRSTWLQYLLFLAGIFPVSALFVLIYSRTKSVFLCLLFHGSLNAGAAHWFGPLPAGELLPYALWTGLLWITAIPVLLALSSATSRRPAIKTG